MGDMLSQEEINALLGVVNGTTEENKENLEEEINLDELTSEELETLGISGSEDVTSVEEEETFDEEEINYQKEYEEITETAEIYDDVLSDEDKDILGEIGNISMGTSATTLFTILRNKVQITTPYVEITTWKELADTYKRPCVAIRVNYKEGFRGSNILILKQRDVKIISNLMMGGDGIVEDNEPLTEIDLSAIGEAMNQMVGSASTSLSSMTNFKIDIETPVAFELDFNEDDFFVQLDSSENEKIVKTSFKMEVGDIINSNIMQILNLDFAREMIALLKKDWTVFDENIDEKENEAMEKSTSIGNMAEAKEKKHTEQNYKKAHTVSQNINVAPAQFQDFDFTELSQQKENISMIMDIPLEVTVELGRTSKKIKDILEFAPGTIVELDKIAGEPIDVLVNGKFMAKGEVVVIDENFGIRIVEISSVEERI